MTGLFGPQCRGFATKNFVYCPKYKHYKAEYRNSCEEYRTSCEEYRTSRDDNSKRTHFFYFFFKSIHPFFHPPANPAAAFLNLSTNSTIILSTIQVGKQISVNHRLTKLKQNENIKESATAMMITSEIKKKNIR